MSRKAKCCDNAAMESFWATLKAERVCRTRFHDTRRFHGALGYLAPAQFEQPS